MKQMVMIIKIFIINIMVIKYMFLSVIILLLFINITTEGFKNDNTTYKVCRNKYNNMDNNYLLKENDVSPLPVGFYSSLLNEGGARDEHRYLEPPICSTDHSFSNNYFTNNKLVDCPDLPGNCTTFSNISKKDIYKDDVKLLDDPKFLEGKVNENIRILYDDKIVSNILSVHMLNEEEIAKRADHHQNNH